MAPAKKSKTRSNKNSKDLDDDERVEMKVTSGEVLSIKVKVLLLR
jgi:hypothetical protein